MKVTVRYIGPRISIDTQFKNVLYSLYQNVWYTFDLDEDEIIELFDREKIFEIKPFKFKIDRAEFGYDGVHFYKRKINSKKIKLEKSDLNFKKEKRKK